MPGEFRIIPTDNRKRNADADFDITYLGNSVGRWEGDTLVIDSIGFIDTTWLARGGFFHSDRMHVVEKFTRQGNTILYDVTVEDPDVLVEPWVNPTRTLQRNANPNRRQRRRHLEARPRKNIRGTECSPPRRRNQGHHRSGVGRQESGWTSGSDHLPGRAHAPFPIPR